jgi:hypothetical protein
VGSDRAHRKRRSWWKVLAAVVGVLCCLLVAAYGLAYLTGSSRSENLRSARRAMESFRDRDPRARRPSASVREMASGSRGGCSRERKPMPRSSCPTWAGPKTPRRIGGAARGCPSRPRLHGPHLQPARGMQRGWHHGVLGGYRRRGAELERRRRRRQVPEGTSWQGFHDPEFVKNRQGIELLPRLRRAKPLGYDLRGHLSFIVPRRSLCAQGSGR